MEQDFTIQNKPEDIAKLCKVLAEHYLRTERSSQGETYRPGDKLTIYEMVQGKYCKFDVKVVSYGVGVTEEDTITYLYRVTTLDNILTWTYTSSQLKTRLKRKRKEDKLYRLEGHSIYKFFTEIQENIK